MELQGLPPLLLRRRLIPRLLLIVVVVAALFAAAAVPARAATPGECTDGTLTGGALSRICVPSEGWNGDLVLFAHGYTARGQPLGFQNLTLPDGRTSLPRLVQSLGYAFATTSYRDNGLAVLNGVQDLRDLRDAFKERVGRPRHTYATGVSEGGLVVTLLAERYPREVTGALPTCAPIGNFRKQLDYFGHFRVLFDHFFPGVLPPKPIKVPAEVAVNWDSKYRSLIQAAIALRPDAAEQLIRTSRAAIDPADPRTAVNTATNVLWYNVFATNDARKKLEGNPFDNRTHWYRGSDNDLLLNRRVKRFRADRAALKNLADYQTSGALTVPLVSLHTTGDEVVPYWHELLYEAKAGLSGRTGFTPIPVLRYGHCNFQRQELLSAFSLLVAQSTGRPVPRVQRYDVPQARRDTLRAARVADDSAR